MEKRYKIGIAILLAVVISVILFIFLSNKEEQIEPSPPPASQFPIDIGVGEIIDYNEGITEKSCDNKESIAEKQDCLDKILFAKAIDAKDYNICFSLTSGDFKNRCFETLANYTKNEKVCENIDNEKDKEGCYEKMASVNRNEELCLKIGENSHEIFECKDRVKSYIFSDNNNLAGCAAIKTLEYSNLCQNNIFAKIDDCYQIEEEFRNNCTDFKILVSDIKSESDCNNVNNDGYKKYCILIAELGNKKASEIDSDNDGLNNGNELFMNLDPYNPDVDNDGLLDGEEVLKYKTDPVNADTDNDGYADGEEVGRGTNPLGQ